MSAYSPRTEKMPMPSSIRLFLVLGIVACILAGGQFFIRPYIYGRHPERHPAWDAAIKANEAFRGGDYQWLIDHTDPNEVATRGLTADLIKKVVDIVYKDPENGLTYIAKDFSPSSTITTGFVPALAKLESIHQPIYFRDKRGRLFKVVFVIDVRGSGFKISGLLGSILGGTAIETITHKLRKPSEISQMSPHQINALRRIGIKDVAYDYSGKTKVFPIGNAPEMQLDQLKHVDSREDILTERKGFSNTSTNDK